MEGKVEAGDGPHQLAALHAVPGRVSGQALSSSRALFPAQEAQRYHNMKFRRVFLLFDEVF